MKINTSGKSGFTLVEIMIVVAIIGLLAAIAIPNFVKARERAQINTCIANLKQIEGATQTYMLEEKQISYPASLAPLYPTYIKTSPVCPANGVYTVQGANDRPTCNIANHVLP